MTVTRCDSQRQSLLACCAKSPEIAHLYGCICARGACGGKSTFSTLDFSSHGQGCQYLCKMFLRCFIHCNLPESRVFITSYMACSCVLPFCPSRSPFPSLVPLPFWRLRIPLLIPPYLSSSQPVLLLFTQYVPTTLASTCLLSSFLVASILARRKAQSPERSFYEQPCSPFDIHKTV